MRPLTRKTTYGGRIMNTSNTSFTGFDDLGDDFADIPVTSGKPATMEDASGNKSIAKHGDFFVETCPRCAGSGRYNAPSSRGVMCFKCNGTGKLTFKKCAADRAKTRQKAAERRESKSETNLTLFEAANPEIALWWNSVEGDFDFSRSLKEAVKKYGNLTERQHAAALKCIAKLAEKKVAAAERAEHGEALGPVDITPIRKALDHARASGLRNPKIRLQAGDTSIVIYYAAAHGNNAGSLYVKSNDEDGYFGKITGATFLRGRSVSDELEQAIIKACATPIESAVAYGVTSGQCSCCNRKLTNKLSIELGIGPICRENFFG